MLINRLISIRYFLLVSDFIMLYLLSGFHSEEEPSVDEPIMSSMSLGEISETNTDLKRPNNSAEPEKGKGDQILFYFCSILWSGKDSVVIIKLEIGAKPNASLPSTVSSIVRLGENSGGWDFPSSKVTWPILTCISIFRTCLVDLGWVNMSACNFFVSGPKFTNFFIQLRKDHAC